MDLLRHGTNKEKEQCISISGRWYLTYYRSQLCSLPPKLFRLEKSIQKIHVWLLIRKTLFVYFNVLSVSVFLYLYLWSAGFVSFLIVFLQHNNKNKKLFPLVLSLFQSRNSMSISMIYLNLVAILLRKYHLC